MAPGSGAWRAQDQADRLRFTQAGWREGQAPASNPHAGPTGRTEPAGSTHYSLLGVARDASPADLRRAYRRRLVAAHPDKGGDPDSFRALQAAYAVLSDTSERLIYDEQLDRRLGGLDGSSVAGSGSKGAAGVTAVVHGQTEGHRLSRLQPPCTAHEAGRGNQGAHCGAEVQAATAAIQALQGGSGSCADLAAAHLQRARLHRAAGQLHHALFDAEEALRLQPEEEQAAALAAELAAAAAGGGQPRAGAAEPDGPSCSSDDDPF